MMDDVLSSRTRKRCNVCGEKTKPSSNLMSLSSLSKSRCHHCQRAVAEVDCALTTAARQHKNRLRSTSSSKARMQEATLWQGNKSWSQFNAVSERRTGGRRRIEGAVKRICEAQQGSFGRAEVGKCTSTSTSTSTSAEVIKCTTDRVRSTQRVPSTATSSFRHIGLRLCFN